MSMPSLFWFLRVIALLALLVYAAMYTLVWLVHPRQTEFSEPVAIQLPPAPDPSATGGVIPATGPAAVP